MQGITGAAISVVIGLTVFVFLQNSSNEKALLKATQEAQSISGEIKGNIVHYDTMLRGVRAFISFNKDLSSDGLKSYIHNLTPDAKGINNIFYIPFADRKNAQVISLNNQNVSLSKETILSYELVKQENAADKVVAKISGDNIIINVPVLEKSQSGKTTIGVIGAVFNRDLPFAIPQKIQDNEVFYQVISTKTKKVIYESSSNTSNLEYNYHETPISWDDIALTTRVYKRKNTIQPLSNPKVLIPIGVAMITYLMMMLFVSLLSAHEKAKLVASEMTKEVKHLGWHDSLTQLYNRYKISQELDLKINSLADKNSRLFILCIDLQGFKRINDELGHTAGDVLLQEYAGRLMEKVPYIFDVVARAGGDEFLIFIDAAKLQDITFSTQLDYIYGELDELTVEPFIIREEIFVIRQKIGVSIYPDHGQTAEELFKYAELAMYEAKAHEQNVFVYQTELAKKLTVLNKMKSSLALALENNEFYLVYQPKVLVTSEGIKKNAAEVLCRWKSPVFGNVAPDIFISLAEETGEIHKLGKWVMVEAVKQLSLWHKGGHDLSLSINLSPKQLMNPQLPTEFNNLAKEYKIAAKYLSLEMTENSMIVDKEQSKIMLNQFHESGFRISIDDFGKGHSSLTYLKDYPISEIKMDKAFIDDIVDNEFNQILVEGIILVSTKLGIDLVIEGVESVEQTEFLSKMGCNKFQGYYYSKPLSAPDLEKYLSL